MMKTSSRKSWSLPRFSQGLTLIEALIALLVLSVGMAGMASMHLTSLKAVHSGLQTSLGSSVALEFEERLWLAVGMAGTNQPCPDFGQVAADVEQDWTRETAAAESTLPAWDWSDNQLIDLPQLDIQPTYESGSSLVTLDISWSNPRVDEQTEEFSYAFRFFCSPVPAS